jgi:hypothetical protein
MELIEFIKLIVICISSASLGWWWSVNTVLQVLREKLNLKEEIFGCEYCSATIVCLGFILLNNIPVFAFGVSALSGYLAYMMKRRTDIF